VAKAVTYSAAENVHPLGVMAQSVCVDNQEILQSGKNNSLSFFV